MGRAYWQKHLEAWEQSDLTQEAYCTQNGLSTKSFYRWRHAKRKKQLAATKSSLTLVPVSVSPSPASHGSVIRLHSPGGWRIELPAGNVPWLADVLRHLP
jgi:hypothetical protein